MFISLSFNFQFGFLACGGLMVGSISGSCTLRFTRLDAKWGEINFDFVFLGLGEMTVASFRRPNGAR